MHDSSGRRAENKTRRNPRSRRGRNDDQAEHGRKPARKHPRKATTGPRPVCCSLRQRSGMSPEGGPGAALDDASLGTLSCRRQLGLLEKCCLPPRLPALAGCPSRGEETKCLERRDSLRDEKRAGNEYADGRDADNVDRHRTRSIMRGPRRGRSLSASQGSPREGAGERGRASARRG